MAGRGNGENDEIDGNPDGLCGGQEEIDSNPREGCLEEEKQSEEPEDNIRGTRIHVYTYSFIPGWISPLGWVRPCPWSNLSYCLHAQPRWNLALTATILQDRGETYPGGNSAWF